MKVQVKLEAHNKSNAQLLVDADTYCNDMSTSTYFTAADIVTQIANTRAAATNMRNKINAPYSLTHTDDVKAARKALEHQLTALGHKVEAVANDPTVLDINRVTIVHAAGMHERNVNHAGKHKFAVTNGTTPGDIHPTAEGKAVAHLWAYTEDVINFTNRIDAEPTTTSYTDITGLKLKTEYAVFHRAIHHGRNDAWEGPKLILTSAAGATPIHPLPPTP
ncbi:MAG: hypothetical protein ACYDCN_03245 [Bacteroidia bacterium]